ncbi:hypothetical protein PV08_07948 [Exophiala spinifera]|uniref:Glycosyl transferase family 25 domain-containing protein n=1 Tax=Exophiala spinifera TaxID=91928 RepID=A0A0D1ZIS8_9EURO|nr:uncharacterized protein PV08_07948 [Exophiala spinifera]KIW12762.1 hypothetical protein PV08_07948 [Exophiala spinifera]
MGSSSQTNPAWSTSRASRKYLLSCMVAVITLTLSFAALYASSSSDDFTHLKSSRASLDRFVRRDNLGDVYNSTLGFQKIFAINLPERSDKADTMLLQASLTNFTLDFVDGIRGENVSPKALPLTMNQGNGSIGCWRAHLNVWKRMIQENIETALVFEDDSDWDIGIKAQLHELAKGSRFLLETGSQTPRSPYGDGWSLLWIGHCHTDPNMTDPRRWVIPHDPTVPLAGYRSQFGGHNMTRWAEGDNPDPQTRVVYFQDFAFCTSAYAVTRSAAQKMLYKLSMIPFSLTVDGGMGNMCKGDLHDFRCIAPYPRLIGRSTPPGSMARSSDIQGGNESEDPVLWEALSENVMFSVRQNLQPLLNGESVFKSNFPNPSGDELTLEQITSFKGHIEYLDQPPSSLKGRE